MRGIGFPPHEAVAPDQAVCPIQRPGGWQSAGPHHFRDITASSSAIRNRPVIIRSDAKSVPDYFDDFDVIDGD
jgi:hypothetical protein